MKKITKKAKNKGTKQLEVKVVLSFRELAFENARKAREERAKPSYQAKKTILSNLSSKEAKRLLDDEE